ncbi:tripartite tricarboxylate transporter TctB family protein [Mesorhizobium sp. CAU 1732]|uniref:tripartite tricarboxylate transporter TctB family protein n=1 Tax=Mesorhizobium sp. CAU 1732 TaxID=3140358 RepID=UPI003261A24A
MTDTQKPVTGQIVFQGLLLVASCVLFWEAYGIEGFSSMSGAGVFPMIAAGVMIVTTLVMLANSIRMRVRTDDVTAPLSERLAAIVTLPMVGYMLICAVYVATLDYAGFWVASAIFLFVSFMMLDHKGVVRSALVTAAALAFVFAIFSFVFSVYLP